ncbi:MAG: tRNA-modifying protein YgfZ [Colwellia sp.]|nr:tRNA-modifying protein YgfZ [Colwellia sp.]
MPIKTIDSTRDVAQLPSTYAISLTDYSAISLSGEEQSKYLQGQVTCDVNALNNNSLSHGAHCDAKGKVLSVFRLINRDNEHLLLQPKNSVAASLSALQKFAVFAKVAIKETTQLSFFALVGNQANELLQKEFKSVPDSLTPVIQSGTTTLVYLAGKQERYLIIDEPLAAEKLINSFNLKLYDHALWDLTEIQEGFPILSQATVEHYVPQMLNLQAINGISFTKGCYLGQETVARMQYLGKNKRALFSLVSENNELIQVETICAGDIIEKQLGENWRKAGDILASYTSETQTYLQAVLANDVDTNTVFRLKKQPELLFKLTALPYTINQED